MLRALALALAVSLSAPPAPAAARPSGAAALPPGAGPLEVTRAFYRALHADDARAAAKLASGDASSAIAAYVRLARAHRALEAAVAKRFGREEAGRVGYGNRVQAEVKALLGAAERIDGDAAQVTAPDGRVMATLVRAGKSWKVELEDAVVTAAGAARLREEARATEAESARVIAGIRKGRYADAGAAVRDFERGVARAAGDRAPAAPEPEADAEGTPL